MADPEAAEPPRVAVPAGTAIALALCVVATIGAGVWPGSIADLAHDAVPVPSAAG